MKQIIKILKILLFIIVAPFIAIVEWYVNYYESSGIPPVNNDVLLKYLFEIDQEIWEVKKSKFKISMKYWKN